MTFHVICLLTQNKHLVLQRLGRAEMVVQSCPQKGGSCRYGQGKTPENAHGKN